MVFAEVLGSDEDVVVAGGVEPVADGGSAGGWRSRNFQPACRYERRLRLRISPAGVLRDEGAFGDEI